MSDGASGSGRSGNGKTTKGGLNSLSTPSPEQEKHLQLVKDNMQKRVEEGTAEDVQIDYRMESDGSMTITLGYESFRLIETKVGKKKTVRKRMPMGLSIAAVRVGRDGRILDGVV